MSKPLKYFIVIFLLSLTNLRAQPAGTAIIENGRIDSNYFKWDISFQRINDWTPGDTGWNLIGNSTFCFSFNVNALGPPLLLIDQDSPFNENIYEIDYLMPVQGILAVNITLAPEYSELQFPASKIRLMTVSQFITDPAQYSQVEWDTLNTGLFDNADENIFITYQGNLNTPLPIELKSFTGKYSDSEVILCWTTESETGNYGFEIQKSSKRENQISSWEKIGFVKGSGNSNSQKNYLYVDKAIFNSNIFQYRLKQIDLDGNYSYSESIHINIVPAKYQLYQNYPNPFNPFTTIRYQLPKESNVVLKIYDLLGAEVMQILDQNKKAGIYEVEINASNLASGFYVYRFSADNFVEVKKMILLK